MTAVEFVTAEDWIEAKSVQNSGSALLYTKTWSPKNDADVKATMVFCHGLGEHINRYHELFLEFVQKGVRVASFDQRGFGKTIERYGKKGHNDGMNTTFEDVLLISNKVKIAGKPHFIMGHSMGGGIALAVASRYPEQFDACIGSAPLIQVDPASLPSKIELGLLSLGSSWFPTLGFPGKLDVSFISRDQNEVQKYTSDPLIHPIASFGLLKDMLNNCDDLLNNRVKDFNLPLYIAHGTNDKLTCPISSKKFFDQVPTTDKTYKSYEGYYHELHNESPEHRQVVYRDYVDWIGDRIDKHSSSK
ncbi:Alpha/Beta hydrolase protein [Globomyces pollinis-pini]|nr:Alpha/Beta hydrolase protein [Globomyces pollinis-pini]